jgi:hypothetical protein
MHHKPDVAKIGMFSEQKFHNKVEQQYGSTPYVLDIHIATRPCLIYAGILLFSATQCL